MKYLGAWMGKYRKKVWFALGLNLVVMVALFLVMRPYFETNDDITISGIANGAYDVRDAHLVFINYLLGMLYQLFYSLPGRLPWHTFFQYLVLWMSFSAVTYVILQKMERTAGLCAAGILLIYFSYEGYIRMQFSKVAGIAMGAALFLLFYGVTKEKISPGAIISGWILGCVGSMYRFDLSLVCALLMTGIGLFALLELVYQEKGNRLRRLIAYLVVFGVQLCLVMGLRFFDKHMYYRDPVWKYYDEYNNVRAELMDYGFPDYENNKEAFEALGIDKDAYDLYSGWSFDDPDKFDLEVMKGVLKLRQEKTVDKGLIADYLKKFPRDFFGVRVFYAALIFLLFCMFFGKHNVSSVVAVVYEVLLFYGLYFYLYYTGRYLVNRVDVGLWFAVCLVLLWVLFSGNMKLSPQMCGILFLSVLIMNQRSWNSDWRINGSSSLATRNATRAALEMVSADKEHLYLAKINTISAAGSFGPFNRMPIGVLNNICWLGGWETRSGFSLKTLEKYGVVNPYRDMIGNDAVYLIDTDIDLTMRYIHTYYDETAEAVMIEKIGGCGVYQIGGTDEKADDMD